MTAFQSAIDFALSHEVDWTRHPATEPERWGVHREDPAPYNRLFGPVHDRGGVSGLVLQHGRDPVTRQLAEEIIAGQTVEIQSMQRRLHTLQQRTAKGAEAEFPSLGGTRGP